ncbi:beta-propeller domain-containing protein [Lysinibacillus telephonicus]|uniref:beta-propeller domain-containing protein n=1 Tax=Lysinibacillus telephonicus TaxID=1714840 RepID=UPI00397CE7FB
MKRRFYTSGILLLTIIFISSAVLVFFGKKVEVSAASTVFVNQPYNVHFSHAIEKESINNGDIYLTNEAGKKVDAEITLQPSKQSLSIVASAPGEYVLHVEKNAFKETAAKEEKQTIEFKVLEKIEQLTSAQDLKDYFQTILNSNNRNFGYAQNEASGAKEESADMATSNTSSHSTTNNQVEGIEEGDIVVTDGHHIYSIIDNQIVITDASNPKSLKVTSKISLEPNSYPSQLMLHDDMLIVIVDQYVEMKQEPYMGGISLTKAAFYNIEDAANPKLVREIGQDGYMNGVRKYNNVLYIVTNKTPNYWRLLEDEDVELRPYMYDSASDQITPMDIKQLSILPGSMEPSYTIISAIDLDNLDSKEVQTKGFLGGSSTLYMSNNALYLTAFNYSPTLYESKSSASFTTDIRIMPVPTNTDIYKFSLDRTKVELVGSTSLKGSILNQFSMDEHNGYFRIATTEGNMWGSPEQASKNHLFIFDEQLNKVGELTDLAKGERIYSARFMGDKAYIVTFKQVDPLFVIDLANPEKPKVLGELKIPGFSNYLHPLDENHLIGFGYETETRIDSYSKQPFTTTAGMKISLFDITDYNNPKEQDTVVVGGRGTYSDLQYNHKALFKNNKYSYFGFPVVIYEGKGEYDVQYKGNGALVYEITAENGIQLKGNLVTPAKNGEQYEEWETNISRMLYIDETLYTVSRNEVKSYDLKSFKQLGSVDLK